MAARAGVLAVGLGSLVACGASSEPPRPEAAKAPTAPQGTVVSGPPAASEGAVAIRAPAPGPWQSPLTEVQAERFAAMALACVHRQYPNKIGHVLADARDVAPPSTLTPAFYGCFDWHSAVHGHWLLARLVRRFPEASFVAAARAALDRSLTSAHVAGELAYLDRPDRAGFERPYGLAWLLQLAAELRTWDDPDARRWAEVLAPLERLAADRFAAWIPKLSHPIRSGEHSQTAFAFGLALDWARTAPDPALAETIEKAATRMHTGDHDCALHLEPSGHDFLSPCLGAADLMRRVLPPDQFASWLAVSLPTVPVDGSASWLPSVTATERTDGKLVHLDGLALSRAWMLDGIEAGLPPSDPRRAALRAALDEHARAGFAAVDDAHYEGGHWLASFAVYLGSRRGRPEAP